ncbi:hypothetical protein RCL1_007586 [Eukaryota sp. TZLM3-RCL]
MSITYQQCTRSLNTNSVLGEEFASTKTDTKNFLNTTRKWRSLLDTTNRIFKSNVKYELCPFALFLYGTLGSAALSFLNDFKHIVKKRLNKCFDDVTWTNRLVFTIFKQVPIIISKSLEALSISLDLQAGIRFDESDICFDDIDF